MLDLRTDGQKARAERNKKICSEYTNIRKEQPYASRNKVMNILGKKYGLVIQSVKGILRDNNCYI